ncbi:RDD family protein [Ferruginibacter lapsinanis]|uniref:RDD family protein n=1 Tax=Ferruginibacter lapsinanis TaxID=563172 RepID=UPI001E5E2E0A|nr:RDD family protein [Ferruginibacter lapsinanis]UEG51123.1 RDD family protein [Ferruginibacter lapsinanis]
MNGNEQNFLEDFEYPDHIYATFMQRVWGSVIDMLVLSPIVILNMFNNNYWKSLPLMFIVGIIGIVYKPLLEFKYGATVGKMAMKISVLNYEFQKIQLSHSLMRNIFHILPGIYSLIVAYLVFQMPEFATTRSLDGYSKLSSSIIDMNFYSVAISIVYITDIIFLFSDSKRRTLHDRIGQTFVVRKNSPTT